MVNGDETDIDCGGPSCGGCATGKRCKVDHDCLSLRCQGGTCAAPETCSDKVRNGAETDVDCGGTCSGCGLGKRCLRDSDCKDLVCQAGTCQPAPTCMDKMANGKETDVDCGGGTCPGCAKGGRCDVDSDCAFGHCTMSVCVRNTLGFAVPTPYPLQSSAVNVVVSGDVSGDGFPDVLAGVFTGMEVLLNQGNGKLAASVAYPIANRGANNTSAVAVADFDGNKALDVVTITGGSAYLSLNQGGGAYGMASAFVGVPFMKDVAVGDLDGDGLLDVVSDAVMNAPVVVLLGQKGGTLGVPTVYNNNGFSGLAIADINQDGKQDVVTSQGAGGFMTLFNDGKGGLMPAVKVVGGPTVTLLTADFDGDGRVDVATCNSRLPPPGDPSYLSDLVVYFNDGGGAWDAVHIDIHAGAMWSCGLAAADFDGDQVPDIAVADWPSGVEVAINDGHRRFLPAQGFPAGVGPHSIAVADLDRDGRTDIIVENYVHQASSVLVLMNTTR